MDKSARASLFCFQLIQQSPVKELLGANLLFIDRRIANLGEHRFESLRGGIGRLREKTFMKPLTILQRPGISRAGKCAHDFDRLTLVVAIKIDRLDDRREKRLDEIAIFLDQGPSHHQTCVLNL